MRCGPLRRSTNDLPAVVSPLVSVLPFPAAPQLRRRNVGAGTIAEPAGSLGAAMVPPQMEAAMQPLPPPQAPAPMALSGW